MSITYPGDHPRNTIEKAQRIARDIARLVVIERPSAEELANAPTLIGYFPVARAAMALQGLVTGHPRIQDGRFALTTEIFAIDSEAGWARSWSRFYRLGHPGDAAPRRPQ
jgi:hypothetical protein